MDKKSRTFRDYQGVPQALDGERRRRAAAPCFSKALGNCDHNVLPCSSLLVAGICGDFEHRLRELNPQLQNITYELSDLYSWIDNMPDMRRVCAASAACACLPATLHACGPADPACLWACSQGGCLPCGVGAAALCCLVDTSLPEQTALSSENWCSALVFEKSMSAYVPCGKDWIKKKARCPTAAVPCCCCCPHSIYIAKACALRLWWSTPLTFPAGICAPEADCRATAVTRHCS